MFWTDKIRQVKITLVVMAVVIATASLVVSHFLVMDLAHEERVRMEIWAEAMHSLNTADEDTDLNLVLKVLEENHTIPVVVTDADGNVAMYRNVDIQGGDSMKVAADMARKMQQKKQVIKVELTADSTAEGDSINTQPDYLYVNYDDSVLLTRLAYYPYIQLGVVMLFIVIAIFALLTSKRAEQNKVWVGLSKETAHQLGTPISSLMAWTEILRETHPDDDLIPEMEKDVKRLQLIADRFSKIGSAPERKPVLLDEVLQHVVDYMNRRTSQKVSITYHINQDDASTPLYVNVNAQLFEWVFENLCKNAVDAMEGRGEIHITATIDNHNGIAMKKKPRIIIDVKDNGKGIEASNLQNVFRPGYTTKKRGWGLGLSLAKRIIEEYHDGSIYVLTSERGKGTTFRIEI